MMNITLINRHFLTDRRGYRRLLSIGVGALLSVSTFLTVIPQTAITVYADPIVINDADALLAAINNASTDPDNPTVIQLGADIGCSDINIAAGKHIHLDLNGKALSVYAIDDYGDLTVEGSGSITGSIDHYSYVIFVQTGGKLTLSGGNITGEYTAVSVSDYATFVMTGGRITGIGYVAVSAGAQESTFTMSGGTIISDAIETVTVGGTTNMTGGTIINKKTNGVGAGIRVSGPNLSNATRGRLTISGGTIENTVGGNSLYIQETGWATQTGGTLRGSINCKGQFVYQGGVNDDHPAPVDHTITVTDDGHGTGTPDPMVTSCDGIVQLSAKPKSGWIFDRWTTEDAINIIDPTSATGAWFSMIDSDVTVKANFKADPAVAYTVMVNADPTEGGKVTASKASGKADDEVTVKAAPAEGYKFKTWEVISGGVSLGSLTSKETSFKIKNDNVEITAHFEEDKPAPVTTYDVTVYGDGHGNAAADPTSGESGTKVTISATPDDNYKFREWEVIAGGVELADSKKSETTFNIKNADVEIKAIFEEKEADAYTVTVTNDSHGSAKATPKSGKTGTKVTLKAVSKAGYKFKKWKVVSGGVDLADATKAKTTFTIKEANVKVKAIFGKIYEEPQPEIEPVGDDGIILAWWKVNEAEGYDIFMSRCNHGGKEISPKLVKTIEGNETLQWTATGLKSNKSHKALIKAYVTDKNGKKKYISKSPLMHVYTAGGNKIYTNAKSIKLDTSDGKIKKGKLTLKVKDTYKIKASVKKADSKKKLLPDSHVKTLRYRSSDPGVATVSSKGKITARKKGKCNIYVYAHNGVNKTIKLTVK